MEQIEVHENTGKRLDGILEKIRKDQMTRYGTTITETRSDLVSFLIGFYQESVNRRGS
jgi:hypothetical protein